MALLSRSYSSEGRDRISILSHETLSKTYAGDGEIVSIVRFNVTAPELRGDDYTVTIPYLWEHGWCLDSAKCSPSFPTEFQADALRAVLAFDHDLVEMDPPVMDDA